MNGFHGKDNGYFIYNMLMEMVLVRKNNKTVVNKKVLKYLVIS